LFFIQTKGSDEQEETETTEQKLSVPSVLLCVQMDIPKILAVEKSVKGLAPDVEVHSNS
jgi:hypothetical protein